MAALGIIGLALGLATLIFLSYRGWGMVITSIIASLVVILCNRMDLWEAFSVGYATTMKNYVGSYLLLFFLGTAFGGLMGESGAAKSISIKLIDVLGRNKGILVVVLASAILSYGGVNLFVIVFTIYPIALVLFKEGNVSKRLFPASLFLGCATFTMVSLPGTPAIQNLIPTKVFGTTAYAAPVNGIIVSIFMFALGYSFLVWQQKRLIAQGIGFVPGSKDDLNSIDISNRDGLPNWGLAVLPMIIVILFIFVTKDSLDTIFSVNLALTIGIILVLILFRKNIKNPLQSINESATNSIIALLNTAVIVGFGGVVQASAGFQSVVDFALGLQMNPLVSGAVATGIVAGATGSCSGGLSIFMDALGPQYVQLCTQANIPLEIMHRVICLAGAGLDSLPHSGGFITAIIATQLTHKESYKYFFFTNIAVTSLGCVVAIALFVIFGIV